MTIVRLALKTITCSMDISRTIIPQTCYYIELLIPIWFA